MPKFWMLVGTLLLLTACGDANASPPIAVTSQSVATQPSPVATSAPSVRTAGQVVDALQKSGLPITNVTVYTAETDTNHLLGRPNQYTSKANWHDSRDSNASDTYSVEGFTNADDADARKAYIQTVTKDVAFACEYDDIEGTYLLRISCELTPDQAAAYDTSLRTIVGR
jgi:hypothetical protein